MPKKKQKPEPKPKPPAIVPGVTPCAICKVPSLSVRDVRGRPVCYGCLLYRL